MKQIPISKETLKALQQITYKASRPSRYDKAHVEATFRVFIPLEDLGNVDLITLLKDAVDKQTINQEPQKAQAKAKKDSTNDRKRRK